MCSCPGLQTMSSMPRMEPAQEKELKYATYQLKFLEEQRHSPYWPTLQEKKQSDLSRFTDRYRPEAREQPSLKTVNMQEEVFPKGLWNSFMHTETQREELKGELVALVDMNSAAHTGPSPSPLQPRRRPSARSTGTSTRKEQRYVWLAFLPFVFCGLSLKNSLCSRVFRERPTITPKHRPSRTTWATTKMRRTMTTRRTTLTTEKMMTLAKMTVVKPLTTSRQTNLPRRAPSRPHPVLVSLAKVDQI